MVETRVTLQVINEADYATFIGRLTEINQEGLIFYYIPLETNPGDFVNHECQVTLKSEPNANVLSIEGKIISDFAVQVSTFGLITHHCTVRFFQSLPLIDSDPFFDLCRN
jgi:hypothetical protein